jgi:hypothetical protein
MRALSLPQWWRDCSSAAVFFCEVIGQTLIDPVNPSQIKIACWAMDHLQSQSDVDLMQHRNISSSDARSTQTPRPPILTSSGSNTSPGRCRPAVFLDELYVIENMMPPVEKRLHASNDHLIVPGNGSRIRLISLSQRELCRAIPSGDCRGIPSTQKKHLSVEIILDIAIMSVSGKTAHFWTIQVGT